MKATFTSGQNASQYHIKQTATWTTSGTAYYGERLRKFHHSGKADPDDPLEGSYRSEKNLLYAIDQPGINTILTQRGVNPLGGESALIDSVTFEEHFVTWVQKLTDPLKNKLFETKWHVKIVVRAEARLDKSACDAGVD